jgi:hypothetical protein
MFERLYYREKVTSAYYCGPGPKANTYRLCGIPCGYRAFQSLSGRIDRRFGTFSYGQSFFVDSRFYICVWKVNVIDWLCGPANYSWEDWEAWDV